MIIHEGNVIIEIEEVEIPTNKLMYQIVIPVFLYLYSFHWAMVENGLETHSFPITFITIAGIASRVNNMIIVIIFGGIIAIIDFNGLISYIRNFFRPTSNVRQSINVIQSTIERTFGISLNHSDKILRWFISGSNIMTEIMDDHALLIQHDMMDTMDTFCVSLFRRWIRGVTITYLSVAVATDVIKKLVSKYQIQTKNIRKAEIGLKGRIVNYILLSTVILMDAANASDEVITLIGIIALAVRTGITLFVNYTDVKQSISISCQTSANSFEKEQVILALSSPKSILTENLESRNNSSQPITFNSAQQSSCNSPYMSRQQTRQRNNDHVSTQHSYIPCHCSTTKCNKQAVQTSHKMVANTSYTRAKTTHYVYKMIPKHCAFGIAVIINNEEFKAPLATRSGATIDAYNLSNLFNNLGFDTQCHDNKTHTEMRHILNDVAGMDHNNYDCLMVAILTHGDYGDVLYGTSGRITIQEVIETFSGKRCPTLIGKPKIFIIQACRGRRYNQAVEMYEKNDDLHDAIDSIPTAHASISDYLVAYSTIPGHVSFRNNKIGSIFIHTLVKTFRQHAADEDLITMLERVTNEVTKYQPQGDKQQDSKQSPELRFALRGKIYFNIVKHKCD